MATKYKKLKRDGKVYIVSSTDGGKSWSKPKLYNSKEHRQEKQKANPKYKRVKRDGKVYVVSSTDGGKSWSKPELYTSKDYKKGFLGRPKEKIKDNLKVKVKSINKTDYNVATESGKKAYEKAAKENKDKKVDNNKKKDENRRLTKEERFKHERIAQQERYKTLEAKKKPKYKQVTKEELDKKITEMSKPKESKPKKRLSNREKMRLKNERRFGKEHMKQLDAKNAAFKAMKRGEITKEKFIKDFPRSVTAQRHYGLRR